MALQLTNLNTLKAELKNLEKENGINYNINTKKLDNIKSKNSSTSLLENLTKNIKNNLDSTKVNSELYKIFPNTSLPPEVIDKVKNSVAKSLSLFLTKSNLPLKLKKELSDSINGNCNNLNANRISKNLRSLMDGSTIAAGSGIFDCLPDNKTPDLGKLELTPETALSLLKTIGLGDRLKIKKIEKLSSNPIIKTVLKNTDVEKIIGSKTTHNDSDIIKNASEIDITNLFKEDTILKNKTLTEIKKAKETNNFTSNIKEGISFNNQNVEQTGNKTDEAFKELDNSTNKEEKLKALSKGNNSILIASKLLKNSIAYSSEIKSENEDFTATCLGNFNKFKKEYKNEVYS